MTESLFDTLEIPYGRNNRKLVVRGLSLTDVSRIIVDHKEDLDFLFDDKTKEAVKDDPKAFGWKLVSQFPVLASKLVALAADMPDRAGEVMNLPAPVQLNAIEAIYQLTVEDNGGLQDFLDRILRTIETVKQGMTL